MAGLEINEFSKQCVVLRIADLRVIENVILVVRVLDRFAEFLNPLGGRRCFNRAFWNRLPPEPDSRRDR